MRRERLNLGVMGGLCSRMRAVCAGRILCRQRGWELVVHWPFAEHHLTEWDGFRARMDDMFDTDMVEHNTDGRWSKWLHQDKDGWKMRSCLIEDFDIGPLESVGAEFASLPKTELIQSIMAETTLPHPVIGVQVREWLKQPTSYPVEWYVKRIESLNENYGVLPIFLSADSAAASQAMRTLPNPILETAKDYAYDRMGIIRSCADLFTLAKCDWVIGANCSSASQMVAFMRGAVYVGPHDKPLGIAGGRYEDPWNRRDDNEIADAIRA